jgi:hypothetical protein
MSPFLSPNCQRMMHHQRPGERTDAISGSGATTNACLPRVSDSSSPSAADNPDLWRFAIIIRSSRFSTSEGETFGRVMLEYKEHKRGSVQYSEEGNPERDTAWSGGADTRLSTRQTSYPIALDHDNNGTPGENHAGTALVQGRTAFMPG